MIRDAYIALRDDLREIPEIKLVDWYLEQDFQNREQAVHITPALYISIKDIDWQSHFHHVQRGVMRFELRLITETKHGDENDMLDMTYIGHLNIEQLVYIRMQGAEFQDLSGNTIINSIHRVRQQTHQTINNLVRTSQIFEATVYDYAAVKTYRLHQPTQLDIEVDEPGARDVGR